MFCLVMFMHHIMCLDKFIRFYNSTFQQYDNSNVAHLLRIYP